MGSIAPILVPHKAFVYKLEPTPAQAAAFERTLDLCRELYNTALEQRRIAWKCHEVSVTVKMQRAELPDLRASLPEYQEVPGHVLQDVMLRADRTFLDFFRRIKAHRKCGFPRYQGKRRYNSFTYFEFRPLEQGRQGLPRIERGRLILPKWGAVKVRWSRPIEGVVKTVTIKRAVDGWYVAFACVDVPVIPPAPTGQETGIDVGLDTFATLADGTQIANPRYLKKGQAQLRRRQRRMARRVLGSKRWHRAANLIAKAHQHIRRQRRDFHFKTAVALVRQYDVVYREDLHGEYFHKNPKISYSIRDVGWMTFFEILAFKAACAGKRVVSVHPAYTSQACSGCGVLVPKVWKERTHRCPDCGLTLHRDVNAARNILQIGQSGAGRSPHTLTWATGSSVV